MSNEQLAVAIKQGQSEYIGELWNNTYKLLYKLANEYYNRYGERCACCGVTLEDIKQESYIAFMGMIEAYEPEKGFKFLSYAKLQLKQRAAALLGNGTEKKRPLNFSRSLDEPIQGLDGEDIYIIDTIEDETAAEAFESTEDNIFNTELKNALDRAMREHLTAFQREVITERFYNNKTLSELGAVNGVGFQTIRDTESKALRQLRHHKRELETFIEHYITDHSFFYYSNLRSYRELHESSHDPLFEQLVIERFKKSLSRRSKAFMTDLTAYNTAPGGLDNVKREKLNNGEIG